MISVPVSVPELVKDDVYPRLIRALVDARHTAALRQVDLAKRLGRPQAFVSRYETRERRLDVVDYVAVARAIGVDPVTMLAAVLEEEAGCED